MNRRGFLGQLAAAVAAGALPAKLMADQVKLRFNQPLQDREYDAALLHGGLDFDHLQAYVHESPQGIRAMVMGWNRQQMGITVVTKIETPTRVSSLNISGFKRMPHSVSVAVQGPSGPPAYMQILYPQGGVVEIWRERTPGSHVRMWGIE